MLTGCFSLTLTFFVSLPFYSPMQAGAQDNPKCTGTLSRAHEFLDLTQVWAMCWTDKAPACVSAQHTRTPCWCFSVVHSSMSFSPLLEQKMFLWRGDVSMLLSWSERVVYNNSCLSCFFCLDKREPSRVWEVLSSNEQGTHFRKDVKISWNDYIENHSYYS